MSYYPTEQQWAALEAEHLAATQRAVETAQMLSAVWQLVDSDGVIHLHSGSKCCLNLDTLQPMNLHLKNITRKMHWAVMIDPKLLEDWVSRLDLWAYSQHLVSSVKVWADSSHNHPDLIHYSYTSHANAALLKDVQMYESHMVYHLNRCDMAIMIQKMWRGREGRAKWLEEYAWDWHDRWHSSLVMKIQTSWRRFSKRNELSCRRAMREIDLRLCRARYKAVIDASEKIHKAWAAVKMRRRLYDLARDQQRKHFIQTHGLYNLFMRSVDMAMRKGVDRFVYFDVANNMHILGDRDLDNWVITPQ
jgi:hypothetical protein